jgi:acyl carrier protein
MTFDPTAVRDWMVRYLAELLQISPRDIDLGKSLGDFGLDSVDAVIMAGELEEHFGVEIDPSVIFEFDTLQGMLEAWERSGRSE